MTLIKKTNSIALSNKKEVVLHIFSIIYIGNVVTLFCLAINSVNRHHVSVLGLLSRLFSFVKASCILRSQHLTKCLDLNLDNLLRYPHKFLLKVGFEKIRSDGDIKIRAMTAMIAQMVSMDGISISPS
jgi:hypothetical protein